MEGNVVVIYPDEQTTLLNVELKQHPGGHMLLKKKKFIHYLADPTCYVSEGPIECEASKNCFVIYYNTERGSERQKNHNIGDILAYPEPIYGPVIFAKNNDTCITDEEIEWFKNYRYIPWGEYIKDKLQALWNWF